MRFDIYLESGPQHRKTWVYVPSLPGCSTVGPASEQAVEIARTAIRAASTSFAATASRCRIRSRSSSSWPSHVIERRMLGFGQAVFATDLEPLTPDEVARQLRWAGWSREELVAAARAQQLPLAARPPSGGRSAAAILSHVAGAEWSYVSSTLGTLAGGSAAIAAIERAGEDPWAALGRRAASR